MKTFSLLILLLAASSVDAGELNFKSEKPVSYTVAYEQTLKRGSETVQDIWDYELDFDLVQKKTIDQGICVDVTLKRFGFKVQNAKGLNASYDSANPSKISHKELSDILDSTLFLNFPSRYEKAKNGRLKGEKNNHHFQQYLKEIADKTPSGPIKDILAATNNFWFLDEKTNILSLLSSILNEQFSAQEKGGHQIVTLQSTSLFQAFPLNKLPLAASFEKALGLKPSSFLLFISDSTTAEVIGSWGEKFTTTIRDPNGPTLKEDGACTGTVKWNRDNALIQEREWTWDNEVSDLQNSQINLKFHIKQTIKSK